MQGPDAATASTYTPDQHGQEHSPLVLHVIVLAPVVTYPSAHVNAHVGLLDAWRLYVATLFWYGTK